MVALALDLWAHGDGRPSPHSALVWSIGWASIGVAFTLVVLIFEGGRPASEYLTGFVIEKSLSLDNLFVFVVLFGYFATPAELRYRALLLGIAIAIVLRGIFIVLGAAALESFAAATYVLAAILLLAAIKIARNDGTEVDPEHSLVMRVFRRLVPLARSYEGHRMLTRRNGKRVATPLLAVLLMIASFDVMFAIDSVPAIFAITRDTYVVFAANAFSLLGMISLYFLLENLVERFRYLHLGLAAILGYVALKLALSEVWHPPMGLSFGVIVTALALSALASMHADGRDRRRKARLASPVGDSEQAESEPEPEPAQRHSTGL